MRKLALAIFAGILLPGLVDAQTYSYNPSTVTADTIPLASTVYAGAQYLFTPSNFSPAAPTSGGVITKIYVKPANTDATGGTFSNLIVDMNTTTLSAMSGANWVTGLNTVYTATTTAVPAWTANNWVAITLQTPMVWDGVSNIALGIYQQGFTNPMELRHGSISGTNVRTYGDIYANGTNVVDTNLLAFGFDMACNGEPDQPVITNSAWAAANPLCSGGTTNLTATYPSGSVSSGISYQWQSASSMTGPWSNVTAGTGGTTLNYTTDALSSTTYFRLAATCTTSSQTTYSSEYEVPVGTPVPGAITASAGACPGDTLTFSVPNVSGTTYDWTLPSGWAGTSTSNSIVVVPGTGSGAISVTATSACGPTSIASNLTPLPGSAPTTPGSIFGNNLVCPGSTETYSTLPVPGATSYIWNLPSGWTGSSTTNSITVTTGSTSGSIDVQAMNGCGVSISSAPFSATVLTALATPGAITGADTVCSGAMEIYSVAPVPGATAYSWILPSGWSGTTTTNSIQTFPTAGTGTISVTATVSCASSSSTSMTVVALPIVTPSVTIVSNTSTVCQKTPVLFTATPANAGSTVGYQWMKNSVAIIGATAPNYVDYNLTSTDQISVDISSSARCQSGTTASSNVVSVSVTPSVTAGISISTVPPINICRNTPVTFNASGTGGGSSPGYQWYKNGVLIPTANATSYTDASLDDGDTLTVEMLSTAACVTNALVQSNKVGVHVEDSVQPAVAIAVSPSEYVIPGGFLVFTATNTDGGPKQDYQWQKNGTDIPFETGDTYTSNTLKVGDLISVRMLSYAPCAIQPLVTSNSIRLKSPLSVAGTQMVASLNLYPNPSTGRFTIAAEGWNPSLIGQQLRLDVLSPLGQSVYHVEISPSSADWKTQVDLGSSLASGQYLLRVSSADGSFRSTVPFVLSR